MTTEECALLRSKSQEAGVAMIELAAWLVVLFPVTLFALALCATTHDRNIVQTIPETLMRESPGRIMTWRSDKRGGEFVVDTARLRALTSQLADRALNEVSSATFKLKSAAVRACYWVYSIDSHTGVTIGLRAQGCEERNSQGGLLEASLDSARNTRVSAGRLAEPVRIGSGRSQGYVSQAVLMGVSVGGRFGSWEGLCEQEPVQHAAVWIPRGDSTL